MSGFEAREKARELANVKAQLEKVFADYVSTVGKPNGTSEKIDALIKQVLAESVAFRDAYEAKK